MQSRGFSLFTQLLIGGLALLWQSPAQGGNPAGAHCQSPPCGCVCPDNYCPKPFCLPVPYACGMCDDYCPKPICLPAPYLCGTCDDYCPKPIPAWQGCLPTNWFKCPPMPCQPLQSIVSPAAPTRASSVIWKQYEAP